MTALLARLGARPRQFESASLAAIALCVVLWIRAKTVDQDERGNAERRALFVGLWPPMFWHMASSLDRRAQLRPHSLRAATRARARILRSR
jgi:hypothetical protein